MKYNNILDYMIFSNNGSNQHKKRMFTNLTQIVICNSKLYSLHLLKEIKIKKKKKSKKTQILMMKCSKFKKTLNC
jgi:hypothetical protein